MQIESYSFNMQGFIQRKLHARIRRLLQDFPAVAILGPRQCGKTTLALAIAKETGPSIYVDLERPSDARKLSDPELYFRQSQDRMVCLDEIQRQPDLFPLLRGVIDEHRRNGRFLILGSASRDLIRQSSETLAGRIAYLELTPFLLSEVAGQSPVDPSVEQLLIFSWRIPWISWQEWTAQSRDKLRKFRNPGRSAGLASRSRVQSQCVAMWRRK